MRSAIVALLAASCLLAGCDGGLQIEGRVLTAQGQAATDVPVYLYTNGEADKYDPVLWTDSEGKFKLARLDCPCKFTVELLAIDSAQGMGRVLTDHDTLEKDPNVVIRLDPLPTRKSPGPGPGLSGPAPAGSTTQLREVSTP